MAKTTKKTSGEGWALVADCPRCGAAEPRCRCAAPPVAAGRPVARLRLEKRVGKPVTVIAAEGVAEPDLKALARELKTRCGTGGTVKGTEVELQGDHRDPVRPLLEGRGWRVKG